MSDIATYTFLPWLRQGVANKISGESGNRATIPFDLHIRGKKIDGSGDETATISKNVQIYGPGDITGLEARAIIKTEPRNWITNFEPNYLPFIDFYDEDLPWRYTPFANPSNHRLQPWIGLIVLKEDEFKDRKNIKDKPLPFIKLAKDAKLPDVSQLGLWAHVHINQDLIGKQFTETNTGHVEEKLESLLQQNPDMAYSRILCPRRLKEKEAYHALLVPTFESGRKAGLGEDPSGTGLSDPAWITGSTEDRLLPYYHRWYFRTGSVGDFEYLVRLLEPKPVDSRVGRRDMDVQDPGANLNGIADDPATGDDQKLGGILKLGGALRVPDIFYSPEEFEEVEKYRKWATLSQPYPHPFQSSLANFINLTDSYEQEASLTVNQNAEVDEKIAANDPDLEYDIKQNPDPLITAPLYGRWHAFTQRLLKERDNTTKVSPDDNWAHELNLDPRWRVAAGFGTKIVQENQEDYMKSAWEQVGDVLEANRRVRNAQLAKLASEVWYQNWLQPIKAKSPGKWLSLSSPIHKRVVSEGFTVFYQNKQSILTTSATSINLRKALRLRGKFIKRLPFKDAALADELINRINEEEVSPAPPLETPEGIQTPNDLAEIAKPDNIPEPLSDLLETYPWIKWVPLTLALLVLVLLIIVPFSAFFAGFGIAAIGGLAYVYRLLNNWSTQIQQANSILEENQTPESVDAMPLSPDFRISKPDDKFTASLGNTDSEEAKRFKAALKDVNLMLQESARLGKVEKRPKLDIAHVNEAVMAKINPQNTIPDWVYSGIRLPPVLIPFREKFIEAMAYPKFDLPMYKPLAEHSAELFLPNINYVAQNSISILETNQKFIESYMIGLNHEFARELLWREYPTDQRGSYFRQFWDVTGYLDTQALQLEPLKMRYKKILDQRNMPELKEYFDKLNDTTVTHGDEFLKEAHQVVLREELKDIKPIHYWSKHSKLGENDNREQDVENEEEVVLVIRGELLKKYPTAVIYAHKAVWNYKRENDEDEDSPFLRDENGNKIINLARERALAPVPDGEEDIPSSTTIKLPLYEAKVEPDIYFFGFDLTVCEAKGGTGDQDNSVDERCSDDVRWDDAGWFFVIKERPGEPRFGLDIGGGENIDDNNTIETWNDLGWDDITPAVAEGDFIQIDIETPTIKSEQPLEGDDEEKIEQQQEDKLIDWYQDMNAAHLAYVLYQVPVLVGVHASEMLSGIHTK